MTLTRLYADVVVIGGGVVGLAVAAVLARTGRHVTLLERGPRLAAGISARNSGVVHAGIHAPADSLKTELCLRGRRLLYERAAAHGVPFAKVGKLIVATTDDEVAALLELRGRAASNGVELELLDGPRIKDLEPRVQAVAALWSVESGIVDAAALAADYAREARAHGAEISLRHEVLAVEALGERVLLAVRAPGQDFELSARWVINATGLDAAALAERSGLDVIGRALRMYPCKGDYFRLMGRWAQAVSHLVYPLPVSAGLGIHLTPDLAGGLRAGPDATYVEALDYSLDEGRAEFFAAALRRYLPGIEATDLRADFSGIRPKLQGPEQPFRDFSIESGAAEGMPGLMHLLGIESPGLTASEAIGEHVLSLGRRSGLARTST